MKSLGRLIETIDELKNNLEQVENYLNDSDDVAAFEIRKLIGNGTNFVAYQIDHSNEFHFAPSRFIGYLNNSLKVHLVQGNGKNGTKTSPRINQILHKVRDYDEELEKKYLHFCSKIGAKPKMMKDTQRKYWRLLDIKIPLYEGGVKQVSMNRYERNPEARRRCIDKYGTNCYVHKPIIEKYLNKVKTSDNPICTLIMGAPATGKGYLRNYLNKENLHDFGDVIIDPDDIKTKELKRDYDKYSKRDIVKVAEYVHEEGSYIANKIINKIVEKKGNFSIDKVFGNFDKLKSLIDFLVENGYKVNLICTECNIDVAYKRMIERGKRIGRYVPEDYFKETHEIVNSTFDKIKNYKNLNNSVKYSTEGNPPCIKFEKNGN